MRGGHFHEYMLDTLEDACRKQGWKTRRQVPSRKGRSTGYIDLLVEVGPDSLLLIEVEMATKKRVVNDLRKRADCGENAVLWIVTPTAKLQRSIQRHLRSLDIRERSSVFVLTFEQARRQVANKNPYCNGS